MNTSNASSSSTPAKPAEVWPEPQAAYVHVPFCRHRCGYCNFTLVAGRDDLIEAYLRALAQELELLGRAYPVSTLYFGGGTPSHLAPPQLERLLTLVQEWFVPGHGCEVTLEANPCDIDRDRLQVLAAHGVNRLSLGVQSFDDTKLTLLERDHRRADIERSLELAAQFVPHRCLDLIFGVPGETMDVWQSDLAQATNLGVDHISTYGLTFEPGTHFWSRKLRGQLVPAEEDLERTLYLAGIDRLAEADFLHYEVSNFARPGHESRHNQVYWSGLPYLAVGPGAASYIAGTRKMNHRSTTTWIKRLQAGQSPIADEETLSAEDRARELLVLNMRRRAGVDLASFQQQSGYDVRQLWGTFLDDAIGHGLLEVVDGRLRLTRTGLLVSDSLWEKVLRQ